MEVQAVRSPSGVADAAKLMCGLVEANKALYSNDLATIEDYYQGSWFFDENPELPHEYCPPKGDVLVAYLNGEAAAEFQREVQRFQANVNLTSLPRF